MQKQATITSKGRITVPLEVRRVLRVRIGDKLLFESDGKEVRVRPIRKRAAFSKYRGVGNPGISSGGRSIGKWLREMRGESPLPSIGTWLLRCGTKTRPCVGGAKNLDAAFNPGTLVPAAPVFAELIAAPRRSERLFGFFLRNRNRG